MRRERDAWQLCLIARRVAGRLLWGLPKGHVEPGERLAQTAVREVLEETGLRGALWRRLGAIHYAFLLKPGDRWAGKDLARARRCAKTVHFFLLRFVSGETSAHDDEVAEAAWFPIEQAAAQLAYENERRIARSAALFLSRQP